mmetsp:Transcript_4712/g.17429  ORF Transcript_4712/g.17429 Transcript_4712/m.17429 type:complete len:228 (-) Transcript_4712:1540-2223(-)
MSASYDSSSSKSSSSSSDSYSSSRFLRFFFFVLARTKERPGGSSSKSIWSAAAATAAAVGAALAGARMPKVSLGAARMRCVCGWLPNFKMGWCACSEATFGIAATYSAYNIFCSGWNRATTRYSVLPTSRARTDWSMRWTKSEICVKRTCVLRFILTTSEGDESEHMPFSIGSAKRFLNSARVPSAPPRTKVIMLWYSMRLFCSGVPVSAILRRVRIESRAMNLFVL